MGKDKILKGLFVVCAHIFWAIFIPVVILSLFPLIVFRYFVEKVGPHLNRDFGSILAAQSSFFNQSRVNAPLIFHVDGALDIETMRNFFLERVIHLRNSNGELKYPELQQYRYNWLGFCFWKWDRDFKIENHIQIYDESQHKNQDDVVKHLQSTPFPSERSPWNIYLLKTRMKTNYPNDNEIRSTVAFKLHHSMFDGISLFMLLHTMMGKKLPPAKQTEQDKPTTIYDILKALRFMVWRHSLLFTSPIEYYDSNDWHKQNLKTSNPNSNADFHFSTTGFIPMKLLKSVEQKYKICRTTAVYYGVTAALRKLMIKKSIRIPGRLRGRTPRLRPEHPDKLINHFYGTEINLPVGISDPAEILQSIKNDIVQSNDKQFQLMSNYLVKFIGSLPNFLLRPLSSDQLTTVAFSRLASPPLTLFGTNVLHYNFVAGVLDGNCSIMIYCLGYQDFLNFSILVNSDLITAEETNEISSYIKEELEMLVSSDLSQNQNNLKKLI